MCIRSVWVWATAVMAGTSSTANTTPRNFDLMINLR
jgi:hypothetical protein